MTASKFAMIKQPENVFERIKQALSMPIQNCCAELTVLFDRSSMKDLHMIFPLLVDSIFGPHGTKHWELRSITSATNCQDFQALQHFLSPMGPMFKLIYTLLRDPQLKFEFSLTYLPTKVIQSLNGSSMHPFYADLVCADPQSNRVISLMLNPFDYYFFHFTYHVINPFHQRLSTSGISTWSTVYYVLCCDYLIHFLPTDPGCVVQPILGFYNGKNPLCMLPSFNKQEKSSKLFRLEAVNVGNMQTLKHHPRNEIWRSETIMTVFIDMWLNNDQVLCGYQSFDKSFDVMAPYKKLQLNELPTGEYIRIVRVLVKQLHAFSASSRADDTHMSELKKIVIPYLQSRMYIFLRHLMHRWPLDGSFRLVLELWVSFLQPWRYPGNEYMRAPNQPEVNSDLDEVGAVCAKIIDREYMQFMAENLLAYTILLQQLLPRFIRVDLSSPKLALILYRLTKVFAQPNLVTYLREIEQSTEDIGTSLMHNYLANSSCNLPPLSPTSKWSSSLTHNVSSFSTIDAEQHYWTSNSTANNSSLFESCGKPVGKWNSLIKQKILEFEGPSFVYKPIFHASPAPEVYTLIGHIQKAQELAKAVAQMRIEEDKQQSLGFFGSLRSLFKISDSNDEFTLEERTKVPNYLMLAQSNLMEIFNISENENSIHQANNQAANSPLIQNDLNHFLTPKQVRERAKSIKYEGDPDLYPIRSTEVKFLVRILYQLALKINRDYESQINVLYHKQSFVGKLARQLLQPPLTIYKFDKSILGQSYRTSQSLPPRISLRYFTSYKFIMYVVLAVALSQLCGYGYFTFLCGTAFVWFAYICLKALCEKRSPHNGAALFDRETTTDEDSFRMNQ